MISLRIQLAELQLFLLIVLRVSAIVMTMPIFGSRSIPLVLRFGMAFAAGFVLFPILKLNPAPLSMHLAAFAFGVGREILLGVSVGLCVQLVLAAIQLAGQLAGYQMGLAIANVMDPDSSEQIPILAQYANIIALLLFVITNAHHWFLRALVDSFQMVPLLDARFGGEFAEQLIRMTGNVFVLAVKVGAPVIVALLMTSLAFGLVARTVPQMNVFIVAMPLKIVVGLLFFGFSLPYLCALLRHLFDGMGNSVRLLLSTLAG